MRSKDQTTAGKSGWTTAVLLFAACCQALPAAAEGSSYPSMEMLLAVGLGYLLLVPVVATGIVYAAIKLLRPQKATRGKRVFAVAFFAWVVGLLVFNYSNLGHYLSDNQAIGVGAVLVFGIAFGTAFYARDAKASDIVNP